MSYTLSKVYTCQLELQLIYFIKKRAPMSSGYPDESSEEKECKNKNYTLNFRALI